MSPRFCPLKKPSILAGAVAMLADPSFPKWAETGKKPRLLIISSLSPVNPSHKIQGDSEHVKSPVINTASRKIKRTVNRKQITTENMITHNGKKYRINNGEGRCGLYTPMLHQMIDQFEIAQQKWNRVFVLRVELHMPHETQDNKCITNFNKRLFKRLRRVYGFKNIDFCWAREYHGKGKGQHYHYALFLDGNKIRHSSRINEPIRASWERPMGGYSLGYIKRPFYFVDHESIAQDAIYPSFVFS